MESVRRIVLIGFSGTGKTTVARLLADQLGWSAADTDAEIERRWGKSIPEIFREEGEAAFRASERAVLHDFLTRDEVVLATGGGAAVAAEAWHGDILAKPGTLVIALDASAETILERLQRQAAVEGETVERPLLTGDDPLARIAELKAARQAAYDRAALTISTEGIGPEVVAAELEGLARLGEGRPLRTRLEAPSGTSDILVGPGALRGFGSGVRERWPTAQRVWIVTDTNVGPLHAGAAEETLRAAGFSVSVQAVAAGEGSKSVRTAGELYDWLLGGGVERSDVVVALGGGMVGDLAGFVAATVLRGIGLVQAPTTLLAAVDSSVGGKTGVNHAAGKNLIGAFLQPRLVLVDTTLLRTVPPRELRSGWAEVVKHAVIQRSTPGGERGDLASVLRRNGQRLRGLDEPAIAYLVWRNIGLKAGVVMADEREAGIRAYLNFGHTLGHAFEAADYSLLHGEAVALGMRVAAEIGVLRGSCSRAEAERIWTLIGDFGLPESADLDEAIVLRRLQSDKKRVSGRQRYVLPLDGGGVVLRDDVPDEDVARALASVPVATAAI